MFNTEQMYWTYRSHKKNQFSRDMQYRVLLLTFFQLLNYFCKTAPLKETATYQAT